MKTEVGGWKCERAGPTRLGLLLALAAALGAASIGTTAAAAEDDAAKAQAEKAPGAASEPRYAPPAEKGGSLASAAPSPLYVPPELGAPGQRVAAGTRGGGRSASILLLVPDHIGYTTREQPILYWYLAEPTTTRIDLTLRDETSVAPLLDVQLPTPAQAGIHAVRLAEHGVRLRPDTSYQWFVSLVPDPERRSKDFVAGGWIRRREPDAVLRERLGAAPTGSEAVAYAESGIWYEAIDALSSRIEAAPGDAALHEQRAALLEQAGLSAVAAYDRANGAGKR